MTNRPRSLPAALALALAMSCSQGNQEPDPTTRSGSPAETSTSTSEPALPACQPEPFEVRDDATYQRLVEARLGAEVVRVELQTDYRPRVAAVLTLVVAYAARNPLARPAQLTRFAEEVDSALGGWAHDDPDLESPSHLVTALRFGPASVSHADLAGTDTDVGETAARWLGMDVRQGPRTDRAVAFDRAHLVRFDRHRPFSRLVSQALLDRSPDGCVHDGLSSVFEAWATSHGWPLRPSNLETSYPALASAQAALPASFAAYVAERDGGFPGLRATITQSYEDTADRITALSDEIEQALQAHPDAVAARPPTAEEVAEIAARRESEAAERAQSRATVSLIAALMAQSEVDEHVGYAAQAEEVAEAQGVTEDVMSHVRDGIKIGGGAVALVAGLKLLKPGLAIGGLIQVVDGTYSMFGPDTPTPEEEILDQILELRQQVEDLRVQMHARFDRIDRRLNEMFDALAAGLNKLDERTRTIDGNVRDLSRDLYATRSSVLSSRLGLHEALQSGLLEPLIDDMETGLGYRERTGVDLEYTNSGQNAFFALQSRFYTAAVDDARNAAHAGPDTLEIDEATVTLSGNRSLQINALAQFPTTLGGSPLSSERLANPQMWSLGADAFAQLARENPWYFAKVYESAPERLSTLISTGEQVEAAMQRAADETWIRRLVEAYQAEVEALEQEVGIVAFLREGEYSEDLNPYLGLDQDPGILGLSVDTNIPETYAFPDGFDYPALWRLHDPLFAAAAASQFPDWTIARWQTTRPQFSHNAGRSPATSLSMPLVDLTLSGGIEVWGELAGLGLDYEPAPPKDPLEWFADRPGLLEMLCGAAPGSRVEVDGITIVVVWRETSPWRWPFDPEPLPRPDATAVEAHIVGIGEAYTQRLDQRLAATAGDFRRIDNLSAILDAYVGLGAPATLLNDEVLRARLRGDAQVRLGHLEAVGGPGRYEAFDDARQSQIRPPELERTLIPAGDDVLERLLDGLGGSDDQSHDYLEWSLQGLRALDASALALSTDDTYTTEVGVTLSVSSDEGVLVNDAEQPGAASITVEVTQQPAHGTLTLESDGSLMYVPDPGYAGEDSFEYEATAILVADLPDTTQVTAEPATVVVRVE